MSHYGRPSRDHVDPYSTIDLAAPNARMRMNLGNSIKYDEKHHVDTPTHINTPRDFNRNHSPVRPGPGGNALRPRFDTALSDSSCSRSMEEIAAAASSPRTGDRGRRSAPRDSQRRESSRAREPSMDVRGRHSTSGVLRTALGTAAVSPSGNVSERSAVAPLVGAAGSGASVAVSEFAAAAALFSSGQDIAKQALTQASIGVAPPAAHPSVAPPAMGLRPKPVAPVGAPGVPAVAQVARPASDQGSAASTPPAGGGISAFAAAAAAFDTGLSISRGQVAQSVPVVTAASATPPPPQVPGAPPAPSTVTLAIPPAPIVPQSGRSIAAVAPARVTPPPVSSISLPVPPRSMLTPPTFPVKKFGSKADDSGHSDYSDDFEQEPAIAGSTPQAPPPASPQLPLPSEVRQQPLMPPPPATPQTPPISRPPLIPQPSIKSSQTFQPASPESPAIVVASGVSPLPLSVAPALVAHVPVGPTSIAPVGAPLAAPPAPVPVPAVAAAVASSVPAPPRPPAAACPSPSVSASLAPVPKPPQVPLTQAAPQQPVQPSLRTEPEVKHPVPPLSQVGLLQQAVERPTPPLNHTLAPQLADTMADLGTMDKRGSMQQMLLQHQALEGQRQLEHAHVQKLEMQRQIQDAQLRQDEARLLQLQLQQQSEERAAQRLLHQQQAEVNRLISQTEQDAAAREQELQLQLRKLQEQLHLQRAANISGLAGSQAMLDDKALEFLSGDESHFLSPLAPACLEASLGGYPAFSLGRGRGGRQGTVSGRGQSVRNRSRGSLAYGGATPQFEGAPRSTELRVRVEVRRQEDLLLIASCIGADSTLRKDVDINGLVLARGFRLLKEGPLKDCKLLRPALEHLQPWVRLTFERPRHLQQWARLTFEPSGCKTFGIEECGIPYDPGSKQGDVLSWNFPCPCCHERYPIHASYQSTAQYLLRRVLPPDAYSLEPPPRDLWHLSRVAVPAPAPRSSRKASRGAAADACDTTGVGPCGQTGNMVRAPKDEKGHPLVESCAHGHRYQCTPCRRWMEPGAPMWGCVECSFFVCAGCFLRARTNAGSFDPPPPLRPEEVRKREANQRDNRRIALLQGFTSQRFDLSAVLHFGNLRILSVTEPGVAAKVSRLLVRRPSGELVPLAEPYDYYARAILLHAEAAAAVGRNPPMQERRLHEARLSLLAALDFPFLDAMKTVHRLSGASGDPRIWYLLGLVQCDLGEFVESRRTYRQVLAQLPVAFATAVHFNLACMHAAQNGAAARVAALQELREFRRLCGAQRVELASKEEPCELCGARAHKW